jgi:hypothetical protein
MIAEWCAEALKLEKVEETKMHKVNFDWESI